MKAGKQFALSTRYRRALIVLGTLVTLVTAVACSKNSSKQVMSSRVSRSSAPLKPAALSTVVPVASQPEIEVVKPKQPRSTKTSSYISRDYGVSFRYPWQYAFLNARTISKADSSLKPRSDGHDGQFTLARVEIPRGFYPDTDFDSGYFILSLNQNLGEQDCLKSLSPAKDAKLDTVGIDGRDFHWIETSSGGKGL